jgi:hypothetical protein
MTVKELIRSLEALKMPDARVVKFEKSGKLAIDVESISKIEINDKDDGFVIAIE